MWKRAKKEKKEKEDLDYKCRWPTQQTLVESQETEVLRSKRIRALEAVSTPLLWLNLKLEQWQEDIDHRMQELEAAKRKRASDSRILAGPKAPGPLSRKVSRPGKSTHPYDTGVGTPTETASEGHVEPREQPNERPATTGPRQTPWGVDRYSKTPRPDSRTGPKVKAREVSQRGERIQLGGEHRPGTQLTASSTPSPAQFSVGREGYAASHKRWWWPFQGKRDTKEGAAESDPDSTEQSAMEGEDDELTALVKPSHAWKSVKGRRGTGYPSGVPTVARVRANSGGSTRKKAQRHAAQMRFENQTGHSRVRLKADMSTQARNAMGIRTSRAPSRRNHEVQGLNARARRKESLSPTQPRSGIGSNRDGAQFTKEPGRTEATTRNASPKTPNQIFRLLAGSKRTPPPRSVSPLDIDNYAMTGAMPTPPPGPKRPSPESGTSGGRSTESRNRGWMPFWGSPKVEATPAPAPDPARSRSANQKRSPQLDKRSRKELRTG
ncbi:Uu.00g132480.m01.CDS01 [Anthostomella pinea]|uniref:Uu.00g132480.m01.CDS01 n=1 Tax=Anthostomella pinea TaxID=933095 RepID=A0AAI8VJ20_9PEZI|nr:Uu.00g132480.m01.CDS01 [Anthostomella pinea]